MHTLHSTRRRGTLLVGVALSAALILSGCTADAEDTESSTQGNTTESSLLPAAEGVTEYPLTLETAWGETVLEERPDRISLVGVGSEIELLALLDVTPTGAPDTAGDADLTVYPWAVDLLGAPVESTWEWSYDNPAPAESIAASDPDLIIADSTTTDEIYAKLSAIAPVLYVGEDDMTWDEQITEIGEALDLSAAANDEITADGEYWETFRADHAEFQGATLTYFIVWGGDYGAAVGNTPGSAAEQGFSNWGFETNPQLAEFVDVSEISAELLPLLDADLVIGYDSSSGDFDDLVSSPLFTELSAVKSGAYVKFSYDTDGSSLLINDEPLDFQGHLGQALNGVTGPLGARYAAEALAPYFANALS